MKEFIKIIFAGVEILCISVSTITLLALEIPLFKNLINASGFKAVGWFVVMVIIFVVAVMFLWMLGVVAINGNLNKH